MLSLLFVMTVTDIIKSISKEWSNKHDNTIKVLLVKHNNTIKVLLVKHNNTINSDDSRDTQIAISYEAQ